jgi:hypothetical protein
MGMKVLDHVDALCVITLCLWTDETLDANN